MGEIILFMAIVSAIFVIGVKISKFRKLSYIEEGLNQEIEHLNKLISEYEIPADEYTLKKKRTMPIIKATKVRYYSGFPVIDSDKEKRNFAYDLTMFCWIKEGIIYV